MFSFNYNQKKLFIIMNHSMIVQTFDQIKFALVYFFICLKYVIKVKVLIIPPLYPIIIYINSI